MGLLGEIYSFGNRTRNKLRGLLDDPKGYIQQTADQTANTLRDMSGANETAQQFALRDKINAGDKNALAQYRNLEKTIQNKLFDVALNFNPAAVGMTAWHGSPHKFDKFDLAKIGTGEGAQAYGHGLYLAEAPKVAQEYADALGKEVLIKGKPAFKAKDGTMAGDLPVSSGAAGHLRMNDWDLNKAIKDAENTFIDTGDQWFAKVHKELSALKPEDVQINRGQMYKTDIPDEAVARFLDWDKKLSEQAPEVRNKLLGHNVSGGRMAGDRDPLTPALLSDRFARNEGESARWAYQQLADELGGATKAADYLKQQGIPGIRYLDGGSRAAGQGSSNFVVFDPNMIRILERNGQATGAQPWKPGEWGGLLK